MTTHMRGDVERKNYYGRGEQPWDVSVRLGWGAPTAASHVLRYLRRPAKDPLANIDLKLYTMTLDEVELRRKSLEATQVHSLESARWYYKRLIEGINLVDKPLGDRLLIVWADVLMQLHKELTPEEFKLLETA